MKKNNGWFYNFYKEWKGLLDFGIPILLGVIGLILGFIIKNRLLPSFDVDEKTSVIVISGVTALPVGLYSRLTNHYATKIQEDRDYDELAVKQSQINNQRRKIEALTKKLEKKHTSTIGTYDYARTLTTSIRDYLNNHNIPRPHIIAICEILNTGDNNLYNLTIKQQEVFINIYDEDETAEEHEEPAKNTRPSIDVDKVIQDV